MKIASTAISAPNKYNLQSCKRFVSMLVLKNQTVDFLRIITIFLALTVWGNVRFFRVFIKERPNIIVTFLSWNTKAIKIWGKRISYFSGRFSTNFSLNLNSKLASKILFVRSMQRVLLCFTWMPFVLKLQHLCEFIWVFLQYFLIKLLKASWRRTRLNNITPFDL